MNWNTPAICRKRSGKIHVTAFEDGISSVRGDHEAVPARNRNATQLLAQVGCGRRAVKIVLLGLDPRFHLTNVFEQSDGLPGMPGNDDYIAHLADALPLFRRHRLNTTAAKILPGHVTHSLVGLDRGHCTPAFAMACPLSTVTQTIAVLSRIG